MKNLYEKNEVEILKNSLELLRQKTGEQQH